MGVAGSSPVRNQGFDIQSANSRQVPLLITKRYADAYGWFCPEFGIIRPDNVSEIDYIAGVRRGDYPWPSRKSRLEKLRACQEEWTAKNMVVMAELLRLG